MRITSSMISKQYTKNLNQSLSDLNDATNKSTTYRKFEKASEDPFSAAKAYRLRREFQKNADYQDTLSDVDSQLLTSQSSMMSINSVVTEASSGDCLQAITGTTSESDRSVIATKLRELQQSVVSMANTQFSDKYVFGGAETETPPFAVADDGDLLYKGIDVNTGEIEAGTTTTFNNTQIQFGKQTGTAFNGYTIQIASGASGSADSVAVSGSTITISMDIAAGKTNQDLLTALTSATGLTDGSGNALDFSKITMTGEMTIPVTNGMTSAAAYDTVGQAGLKALANETAYVDLGLGLRLNSDGSVNSQSVFDTAIPGISFMGYGTTDGTATGVSKNLYTLLGQIADQLESPNFSMDTIQPYLDSFSDQGDVLLAEITKSGTDSNFLTTTQAQLVKMGDSIDEKMNDVEFLDPADALIDYKMQAAAYQAALQMGTKILQPTFLDFMD